MKCNSRVSNRIIRLVFCFSFDLKKSSIGIGFNGMENGGIIDFSSSTVDYFFAIFLHFLLNFLPWCVLRLSFCLFLGSKFNGVEVVAHKSFAGSKRCVLSAFALISNYRFMISVYTLQMHLYFPLRHKHMTHVILFFLHCIGKWLH